MPAVCTPERLASAVHASTSWSAVMRELGVTESGGRRRTLQRTASELVIDTSHFRRRSPWQKYTDQAIADAVADSSTLREVVTRLGAAPATGTLSHIRRRIAAAGIDVSHLPGLNRSGVDLPFTDEELRGAAANATSLRAAARALGVPDDGRSRAALRRRLAELGVSTSHFTHARVALPEDRLRDEVPRALSYAEVMRALGLPVTDANHRRVQRRAAQLGLDTSHFTRRSTRVLECASPRPMAHRVLVVRPAGSARVNRDRLRRALDEIGVPYRCVFCGNDGEWRGVRVTLQIDHVNGDWLDNRAENLRYLCPNCHATTDTWCRNRKTIPVSR